MKPIKEIAEIRNLCDKFNYPFNEKLLVYSASNGEECIGAGFFEIEDRTLDIKAIVLTDVSDKLLGDGIKRAVLNYGTLEGAYLYSINGSPEESIVEFFSQGCKGNL